MRKRLRWRAGRAWGGVAPAVLGRKRSAVLAVEGA